MSNPLLLIRIEASPTENCLNIAFAEAEYDGKLVRADKVSAGTLRRCLSGASSLRCLGYLDFIPKAAGFSGLFFRPTVGASASSGRSSTLVLESRGK